MDLISLIEEEEGAFREAGATLEEEEARLKGLTLLMNLVQEESKYMYNCYNSESNNCINSTNCKHMKKITSMHIQCSI